MFYRFFGCLPEGNPPDYPLSISKNPIKIAILPPTNGDYPHVFPSPRLWAQARHYGGLQQRQLLYSRQLPHGVQWWRSAKCLGDFMVGLMISLGIILAFIPSGSLTVCYWKWPIEIVDLPNLKMVIFHSYVSLPEGILWIIIIQERGIPINQPVVGAPVR